ncbi:MAG: hypothetical protein EP329_23645 [Deltaproteobacteria bacterium]|nr:MAG: hypothetical protein EP329_23645 [Deltaproteobacteria bacterium]
MRIQRLFGTALAAGFLVTATGGLASAQFGGIPKPPKISVPSASPSAAQRKQFNECDQKSRKGLDALPSTYTSNAEKRQQDVDKAAALLAEAEALCTPDLRAMSSWDSTEKRLVELRLGVADGQQQVAILTRYEPLSKAEKHTVQMADLDELDGLVKAYEESVSTDDTKRYAKNWRSRVDSLREEVEKRQKGLADKKAQAEEDTAMLAMHDAIDGAEATLEAIEAAARKAEGPIPAELYDRYEAQVKAIEAFNPTARLYYEPRLRIYRAYDAWLAGDGAADALAKLYEGEVVAKGQSKGKKQAIGFAAKAGWCYAILLHFDEPGADSDLDFKDETKMRKVLRFYDDDTLKPWQRLNGFCANEAFKVDLGGPLTFTGTKNVQRWVAVGWAREQFPASLSLHIRPWIDECDPIQYEESWLHPIPGTVKNRQPGDIKEWKPSYAGEGQCAIMPGTRTNPDANKYGKCVAAVTSSYAPKFRSAAKARDDARTVGAHKAAQKRLDALETAQANELTRKCDPTLDKIRKAFEKSVDKVADAMKGEAYSDHVDRAKRKADEEAGHMRPRNKAGEPDKLRDRDDRRSRMKLYEEYYKDKAE